MPISLAARASEQGPVGVYDAEMAWARHLYRGNKVWIETDAAGRPAADARGLVPMRYKPDDDRTYSVRAAHVHALGEERAASTGCNTLDLYVATARVGAHIGMGALLRWRGHERVVGQARPGEDEADGIWPAIELGLAAIKRRNLPVRIYTTSGLAVQHLEGRAPREAGPIGARRLRPVLAAFEDVALVKVRVDAEHPQLARAAVQAEEEATRADTR